jgi:flagellar biosynthesis chaperone FliJ
MTPRTMDRLDLMAAASETRLLDEIRRLNASLDQLAHQRGVLAAYRDRLAQSWRSGGVVEAGAARRAGHFSAASRSAEVQLDQAEAQARQDLDKALQNLAQVQQRRRGLEDAQRKAAVQAERTAELRLERARPWIKPEPDKSGRLP